VGWNGSVKQLDVVLRDFFNHSVDFLFLIVLWSASTFSFLFLTGYVCDPCIFMLCHGLVSRVDSITLISSCIISFLQPSLRAFEAVN